MLRSRCQLTVCFCENVFLCNFIFLTETLCSLHIWPESWFIHTSTMVNTYLMFKIGKDVKDQVQIDLNSQTYQRTLWMLLYMVSNYYLKLHLHVFINPSLNGLFFEIQTIEFIRETNSAWKWGDWWLHLRKVSLSIKCLSCWRAANLPLTIFLRHSQLLHQNLIWKRSLFMVIAQTYDLQRSILNRKETANKA